MKRLISQIIFFLLQNPLLNNFFTGKIYQGKLKTLCTPGLNCYSCPAAITSCPLGAMQLFLGGAKHSLSLFVTGFLLTTGIVFGRFICGYVCPFGLFQDLLYKIKTPKLKRKFKYARYIKYIILLVFVIVLPLIIRNDLSGLGSPWFCMYICPSGTVFGAIPLLITTEALRESLGLRFIIKAAGAVAIIVMSATIYRFFCRVICPLGAIYSLFNKLAFVKMSCDKSKCISCGDCSRACNIMLTPSEKPNSPECVRCGDCIKACNFSVIKCSIKLK
ncbi:MAG: 4Fe-4S binding protein [Oscillospiraceae bacterium]|nr:4Fe-4S binding protein [Oscillospiraceae bacterium]